MLSVSSIQYLSTCASMVLFYRDTHPSVVLSTRMDDDNTDISNPRRSNVDLSLEFNSFNYKYYGMCDYEQLIDPNNNLYNKISVSCSYYTNEQFNPGAAINDTTFSIAHFNVRSLKKNFAKIKDCLDALKCSFDIIAISETWEDQTNPISGYEISNYNAFCTARTNKKGEM